MGKTRIIFVTIAMASFLALVIYHIRYVDFERKPVYVSQLLGDQIVYESSNPTTPSNMIVPSQLMESSDYSIQSSSIKLSGSHTKAGPKRLNVLFIIVDDMRAQISPYPDEISGFTSGAGRLITPHLEKLASRSLLLKNMFVQFSFCGPSRTSMLTSRRPETTHIYDNTHYWRREGGNFTTLPQHFKENGYFVHGIGKIFHGSRSSNNNDPMSWSTDYPTVEDYETVHRPEPGTGWLAVNEEREKRMPLVDTLHLSMAKDVLKQMAPAALSGEQPFFLGVGFRKPHVSLVCPKKYFDLYPLETMTQYLSNISWQEPEISTSSALYNSTLLRDHTPVVASEKLRLFRQAYFACISYVDTLVGELVRTVEELGLGDNTIISFIADHGYHLGENGFFAKRTLLDASTRVPAMIRIPGLTDLGITSDSIVEAVDVFPTIVKAAGLSPIDKCPIHSSDVRTCTEGKSFLSLVDDPEEVIHPFALSQVNHGVRMGFSLRTKRYRYIQFFIKDRDSNRYVPVKDLSPHHSPQMFDFKSSSLEEYNVVMNSTYAAVRDTLKKKLNEYISRT